LGKSVHCHGVAKLKNDPGLWKRSETAPKGYLAEKSFDNAELADLPKLNGMVKKLQMLFASMWIGCYLHTTQILLIMELG